jgi:hypothetical protein
MLRRFLIAAAGLSVAASSVALASTGAQAAPAAFTCNIAGVASFTPPLGLTPSTSTAIKFAGKLTSCTANAHNLTLGKVVTSATGQSGVTCNPSAPANTVTTAGHITWLSGAVTVGKNNISVQSTSVPNSSPPTTNLMGTTTSASNGNVPPVGTTSTGSIHYTVTATVMTQCAAGTLAKIKFLGTTTINAA